MSVVKRIEQPAEEEDLGRDPMQMVKDIADHKRARVTRGTEFAF